MNNWQEFGIALLFLFVCLLVFLVQDAIKYSPAPAWWRSNGRGLFLAFIAGAFLSAIIAVLIGKT
jgi:hypothetical protein